MKMRRGDEARWTWGTAWVAPLGDHKSIGDRTDDLPSEWRSNFRPAHRRADQARLYIEQRLVEVGDDIFYILDAHRQAHQAFRDAHAILNFLGHGSVGHHCGKRNQGFHASEAFGERAKLDVVQESARGIQRTHFEGKHRSRALLLAAGHFVLWMRLQAWIEDLFYFWMSIEMARHGNAVGIVLEHTDGQGLDAARNEEAIHGRQSRSGRALDEINFLGVLGTRQHHCSAGGVTVAVQILCHGMHNDVRAELDGTLQIRTEKGVIDRHREITLAGQLGNRRDIGDAESGVGRRLDINHFRIGAQRGTHKIRNGRVHEAEFEPEVHQELCRKAEHYTVNRFGKNYMIARTQ